MVPREIGEIGETVSTGFCAIDAPEKKGQAKLHLSHPIFYLYFENNFQFNGHAEWQARYTKHHPSRCLVRAEDITESLYAASATFG